MRQIAIYLADDRNFLPVSSTGLPLGVDLVGFFTVSGVFPFLPFFSLAAAAVLTASAPFAVAL